MHTNNPLIALIEILVLPGEAYILLKALNAIFPLGLSRIFINIFLLIFSGSIITCAIDLFLIPEVNLFPISIGNG